MIIETKFEYGNKEIQFNSDCMFVDFVNNNHDLTFYESMLGEGNYSVHLTTHKYGGSVHYKLITLWALVTTKEKLNEHYLKYMKKDF